jgi:hypothetical protein
MPDKTPKKKTTKKNGQETAQTDMVGSYTETIGKWFTESKEKGEGENETHQG